MSVEFSTTSRNKALTYLQKVLPDDEVTDTEESAGPLLDLVSEGVVRVQDPMMYGQRIGITPGPQWDDSRRSEVTEAAAQLTA